MVQCGFFVCFLASDIRMSQDFLPPIICANEQWLCFRLVAQHIVFEKISQSPDTHLAHLMSGMLCDFL